MTCLFNHWGITVVVLAVHNFMATQIKAAVLLIGDELLSGRTRDINLQNIAQQVAKNGIDVAEARIIADVPTLIAQHVNQLRQQYDLVFTSGGIGPTHDDRTMDAVAMAFETVADIDPEADQRLREYYAGEGREYTEARRRMARLPKGAALIDNPVSVAPGAHIGNVYVLPGVPKILLAMVEGLLSQLPTSDRVIHREFMVRTPESDLASLMTQMHDLDDAVSVGSYPGMDDEGYFTRVVVRSRAKHLVDQAVKLLGDALGELNELS